MNSTTNFRLRIYLTFFAILAAVAITGFMLFEQMSLTDAVYFSIVTMATVGYGDIHPQTDIGKILTIIVIVGGVGTFLGVVASVTDFFVNRREEAVRRQKVDMMAGLFFSEMGNDLLRDFVQCDTAIGELQAALQITPDWKAADFDKARSRLATYCPAIDSGSGDFPTLLSRLQDHSDLLLRLIENPLIQEHGTFPDLLRALFHLRDELLHREALDNLLAADREHLEGDIARVYRLMISEWLRYVYYLKGNYDYLYSLAMRLNPFDPESSAVVKGK